ncbi:MAG: hypothetical protein C4576_25205 [Desulfobacteraceae bacterium]|nr:MAG: hypothetical protein C4576_25205 [Desulfobacteraceae bacterium]
MTITEPFLQQRSTIPLRQDNDLIRDVSHVFRVLDLLDKAPPSGKILRIEIPCVVNMLDQFRSRHLCRDRSPYMGIEGVTVDDLYAVLQYVFAQSGDDSECRKAFDFVACLRKLEQVYPQIFEALLEFSAIGVPHMDFKPFLVEGTYEIE